MARKLRLSLSLAEWVVLAGSGLIQDLTAGQGPSVKAPVDAEGDWWIFRVKSPDFIEEIRVDYNNDRFESDNLTFLNSIVWMSVYLKDSKKKWLKFPLVPGKNGVLDFDIRV